MYKDGAKNIYTAAISDDGGRDRNGNAGVIISHP
jgi:hypothetical protein